MKLSSKELWEFHMNMHQKRQKGLSPHFLSTLAHTRLCHALSTYARSRGEFHFMTHLKYQHLNVDVLFGGLAAAAIPLQGKGKTQSTFCDKSDEEVCVAHMPRVRGTFLPLQHRASGCLLSQVCFSSPPELIFKESFCTNNGKV